MKKMVLALTLACLTAAPALATENTSSTKYGLGLDFAMPYSLMVDGESQTNRGNFNIGLDGRYWNTENMNFGVRFAFDVEKRTGSERAIALAPGLQYHWMTAADSFRPFVRFDLPMTLANATATSNFEVGASAGLGLVWNLGSMIGVENMSVRYDFDMLYTFGLSDAVPVLALEIFKIGFDYKF